MKDKMTLEQRVERLERRQRSDRFLRQILQYHVDELTQEFFNDDPAKMLALGARLTEYKLYMQDSMGITTAEIEAANCSDEAEDASEEEEAGTDEL